jgi:DNA polymerase III delta prime subunit
MQTLWTQKYKPKKIDDIIGQDEIKTIFKNALKNNHIDHMLFYGSNSTGKTSSIHAFCNEYYGKYYKDCVLDLNASDDRGINVIRNNIKQFANTKSLLHNKVVKMIILDEVDNMTIDAQYALRRIIELYTSNVRFCLICNYLHKIHSAIYSRCIIFKFKNLSFKNINNRLSSLHIFNLDEEKKRKVYELSNKDLRKIYTFLQIYDEKDITINNIYEYFYNITLENFKKLENLFIDKSLQFNEIINLLDEDLSLNFIHLINLLFIIAQKKEQYFFIKHLSDIEYKFIDAKQMYYCLFIKELSMLIKINQKYF